MVMKAGVGGACPAAGLLSHVPLPMCMSLRGKAAGLHHAGRPGLNQRVFGGKVRTLACGWVQADREHAATDNA